MVKISWRHWWSGPDICWQMNLFTPYLGSASGKLLERSESMRMKKCFSHRELLLPALWHSRIAVNNIFRLSQEQVCFAPFFLVAHNFVTQTDKVGTSVSHCRLCCRSELSATFNPWCALILELINENIKVGFGVGDGKVSPWIPLFQAH